MSVSHSAATACRAAASSGVYELYNGLVLSVLDVRDAACDDAGHQPHIVLPPESVRGARDEAPGRFD